jgi:integrase
VQVKKFLGKACGDRLHAGWRLSLYGLRPGGVVGLRWSDIDLRAKTLTINQSRSWLSAGSASRNPSPATTSGHCPSTTN